MPVAPSEISTLVRTLGKLTREKSDLLEALRRYGDHSMGCHNAWTAVCICGWTRVRREFKIQPRDGES